MRAVKRRLNFATFWLAIAVAALVMGAFAIGTWLYSRHFYARQLEANRASAQTQAETIRLALEHAMIKGDHAVIGEMVKSFATDPSVADVMLLDHGGVPRFSAGTDARDIRFDRSLPECMGCHAQPPEKRDRSRVVETRGGEVLRIVTPIRNQARCYGCHAPAQQVNGVLIVDVKSGQIRATLERDLREMVVVTGLLALVVIGGIAGIIRIGFLKRLASIESTARAIAGGQLALRLPEEQNDVFGWLGREFNALTDSVVSLTSSVREQSRKLEMIINSVDDGIVVLDRDFTIVAANDAFIARVGRDRADVVGHQCHRGLTNICSDRHCLARSCFGEGKRCASEIECEVPGSETRYEEVHASPIAGPDGETMLVVEAWRDITERRAAQARAAEAHRLASLGMLASGFSHELNTPLGTILTCVEGIRHTAEDGAPDVEYIAGNARIAQDQLLRCRAITQQFLRMARGAAVAHADLVDLRALVPAMTRLVAPTAREARVEVATLVPDEEVTVFACEAEVQQAMLNVLMNAIQVSQPGARVRVLLEPGSPVRLKIEDEGPGIPEAWRRRIFEPFVSQRQGGTGLGLFISLEFARKWGGDILVESEPGHGSTFEIVFPGRPQPRVQGVAS